MAKKTKSRRKARRSIRRRDKRISVNVRQIVGAIPTGGGHSVSHSTIPIPIYQSVPQNLPQPIPVGTPMRTPFGVPDRVSRIGESISTQTEIPSSTIKPRVAFESVPKSVGGSGISSLSSLSGGVRIVNSRRTSSSTEEIHPPSAFKPRAPPRRYITPLERQVDSLTNISMKSPPTPDIGFIKTVPLNNSLGQTPLLTTDTIQPVPITSTFKGVSYPSVGSSVFTTPRVIQPPQEEELPTPPPPPPMESDPSAAKPQTRARIARRMDSNRLFAGLK